jgi:hypothetical protein
MSRKIVCVQCRKRFASRPRLDLHLLAHHTAQDTGESVEEAERSLRRLRADGMVRFPGDGHVVLTQPGHWRGSLAQDEELVSEYWEMEAKVKAREEV